MEPQAEKLMAECVDKNMIDKDEYPQTAELESRCVAMLSRLWHAPEAEAAMLGGLALKHRFHLSAEEAVGRCDENTIGVVAVLSSTFDGSYEPVKEICEALDAFVGIREGGWQLPAYTFPEHRTDLAALRVVVRRGFTHDTADLLLRDLKRLLPRMERQPAPVHDGTGATGFHH